MIKLIFLSLFLFLPLNAVEIFITLKINNEIITNIDINNESKYLVALNNELKNTDKDILNNIAKESLIREKIKKNEISKYYELNITDEYLNMLVKDYYKRLGINSLDNFKQYLKEHNLELNIVKKKIAVEFLWNRLIGSKYKDQISINKKSLQEKVEENFKEGELILEYELSEIIFQAKNEADIKNKIKLIQKEIADQGFKNTANIYSIAETSKFGGKLGWFNEKQLSEKIIDAIKNLLVNDISKPIKIANGFMILKIDNIKEKKIENNKEQLLQELVISETNRKYGQYSLIYYNKLRLNTVISE
jgi:peptidyl-prolyl cis-trans isomerase SurA